MKDLVIPTLKCNEPDNIRGRSDQLLFVGENKTCGGQEYCSGRRIIENSCNALAAKKGYRGMDPRCVVTMIKVQLESVNQLLGLNQTARKKQTMRVEDVEDILNVVYEENQACIGGGESELNCKEAYNLITDLLLEKLYVNKELNNFFFGVSIDRAETKSFKDLDPKLIQKIKSTMNQSAGKLFSAISESKER
jgi:hypothetical protein